MTKPTCTSPVHQIMQILTDEIKKGNEITLDTAQRSMIYKQLAHNEAEKKHVERALAEISEVYAISRVNNKKGKLDHYDVNLTQADVTDNAIISVEQLKLLTAIVLESDYGDKHLQMDVFNDLINTLLIASYGVKIDYDNLELPDKEMLCSLSIGAFSSTPNTQILIRNNYNGEERMITPLEVKIENDQLFVGTCFDHNPKIYWFNISKKWELTSDENQQLLKS